MAKSDNGVLLHDDLLTMYFQFNKVKGALSRNPNSAEQWTVQFKKSLSVYVHYDEGGSVDLDTVVEQIKAA